MRIAVETSFLLIVDMQEKLAPAIDGIEGVTINAARLMAGASRLGVPVLVTEHYPRGLGHTVPALRAHMPAGSIIEKIHFSALSEPGCRERLEALGRHQPIVAGTETHVCVLQTTLALKEAGFEPYVAVDAVSSRKAVDREVALDRLRQAGVGFVTTEMVLFEWLARGDTDEFRDLLPLIKSESLPAAGERQ